MLRQEGRRRERLVIEAVLHLVGGRFAVRIQLEQAGQQAAICEIGRQQHERRGDDDVEEIHSSGWARGRAAEALGYTKAYVIIASFCNRVLCFAMPILNARRYDTLRSVAIEIDAGQIKRISPIDGEPNLPLVAPGLVDLQIN